MLLRELIAVLETLAPPELAESWDNTGLLLGDRDTNIERVLTCLTLTPDVAREAVQKNVQLVVTHHPLMFKPIQQITADKVEGRTLWTLASHGIAVYSPHTAWDNAPQGINQQIAEQLGLTEIRPLRPRSAALGFKLTTTLPETDLEAVQQALWAAGCGELGEYIECSFYAPGTGTFRGSAASQPTIGVPGRWERVAEYRLEVLCPESRLSAAIAALRAAHSYEEPVIDVFPLHPVPDGTGSGRAGDLPQPLPLRELAQRVAAEFGAPALQWVGAETQLVQRLGIACGAAAEFWKDARRDGCQALLTGEARFHAGLEVRDAGFAMIIAGHDATERFAMQRLAELLTQACPQLTASASEVERDPFQSA